MHKYREYSNQRRAKRQPITVDGMIYDRAGQPIARCTMRNVSASGAQIELSQEMDLPINFMLSLSRDGHVRRNCIKVWQFATVVGVRFDPSQKSRSALNLRQLPHFPRRRGKCYRRGMIFPTDLASFLDLIRQHGEAAYGFVFAFAGSHSLLMTLFAGYTAHSAR